MGTAIDCSTTLQNSHLDAFKADGVTHIIRYIDPNPSSWKHLLSDEAERISDKGLQIVSVFERMGDKEHINGSYGSSDGAAALEAATQLGQPVGSCIYFAIDYEASDSDMDNIEQYIRNAGLATPQYTTGVYGSRTVIEEMQRRKACSHFWQTLAWSHSEATDIQMYQYRCDTLVHGVSVDLNRIYGSEGSWNTLGIQAMAASDANKAIGFFQAAWNATTDPEAKAEYKRIANELRRVSGQPQT